MEQNDLVALIGDRDFIKRGSLIVTFPNFPQFFLFSSQFCDGADKCNLDV